VSESPGRTSNGNPDNGNPDNGTTLPTMRRIPVAELAIEGQEVVLHLTKREKVEGVHGDLRVPLTAVTAVDVLDDAHGAADVVGVKVGTRMAGVIEVGTVRAPGRKLFVAVHRDTPRGVRVSLTGADQDEWVVGCADPEAVAAMLARRGGG